MSEVHAQLSDDVDPQAGGGARDDLVEIDVRAFPGCLWCAEEHGRFIVLSSGMSRVFGQSLESLEDLAVAAHPDDVVGHRAAIGGDAQEVRYRVAGGEYRWFEHGSGPAFDKTRLSRRVGVLIDIHERKLAEEARAASEQRAKHLAEIFDNTPCMLITADALGIPEHANRRTMTYLGHAGGDSRPAGWLEQAHPYDRDCLTREWSRSVYFGSAMNVDYRLRRHDGEYRWVHACIEPVRGEQGRIHHWHGLITDIEDRKRAEERLRQSEHRLRQMVDTIPASIIRRQADGTLDCVNDRHLKFLGKRLGDLAGDHWMESVHPEDLDRVIRKHKEALQGCEPYEYSLRMRRADGSYRWFRVLAEPLRGRDGRPLQWYYLLIDIEDQKRAEAERIRLEEAMGQAQVKLARASQIAMVAELSASIAHEIAQPLAAVVQHAHACSRWLSMEPPNMTRAKLTAERIGRDAASAQSIVERIRGLFRRAAPSKEPVDVNALINEVPGLLTDEVRNKGVTVETELDPQLPRAEADRVQLQQVIANLSRNAIDSMDQLAEEFKLIRLRSRLSSANEIVIEVHDRGIGLKEVDRIFEPFFTTKEKGMGMGLAICRSIIEAHGGRLWARPNGGWGTIFSFSVPLRTAGLLIEEAEPKRP